MQDTAKAVKMLQEAKQEQTRFLEHMKYRAATAKGQIDALKRLRTQRTNTG